MSRLSSLDLELCRKVYPVMDEQEWLTSTDPAAMVKAIRDIVSDRRLKLACHAVLCACELGPFDEGYNPIHQNEVGWATNCFGTVSPGSLLDRHPKAVELRPHIIREIVGNPFRPVTLPTKSLCCCGTPLDGSHDHNTCGPPIAEVDCPWLTPIVVSLAEAAYQERDRRCRCLVNSKAGGFLSNDLDCPTCKGTGHIEDGTLDPVRLMVLADALEDAECDNEDILMHLRGFEWGERVLGQGEVLGQGSGWIPLRGPHVRGCWVLDLLTGRK